MYTARDHSDLFAHVASQSSIAMIWMMSCDVSCWVEKGPEVAAGVSLAFCLPPQADFWSYGF